MILEYPQNLVGTFSTSRAFGFFSAVRMGAGRHFSWSCREPSRPFGNRKSHRKTTTIIICSLQQIYPLLSGLNIEPLTSSERYPKPLQNSCNQPSYFLSYPTHCCNVMWEKHVCRYRKKWYITYMWYHHLCSSWCGSSPFSSCTFPGDSFDHENQLLSHHTLAQAAKNWMSSSSKTWFPLRSRPRSWELGNTCSVLLFVLFCFWLARCLRTGCWKYRTTCRGRASLLHFPIFQHAGISQWLQMHTHMWYVWMIDKLPTKNDNMTLLQQKLNDTVWMLQFGDADFISNKPAWYDRLL